MTKFAETLLLELARQDIKQGEFARMIGTYRQQVNQWISGKQEPKLSQIYKVAEALGIDPKMMI